MRYFLSFTLVILSTYGARAQCSTSGNTGGTYISQVFFPFTNASFENLTSSGDQGYADNTGAGSQRTFTWFGQTTNNNTGVTLNFPSAGVDYYYKIWVDYDQDGSFNNVTELAWQGSGTSSGAGDFTDRGTVSMSAGSTSGETKVRIMVKEGSAITGPCETGFTGEVEDYIVTIPPPEFAINTLSKTLMNAEESFEITYAVSFGSLNPGNTLSAELSDAAGSFASPIDLGGELQSASSGTITVTIPAGTPAGSGYRVRLVSSSPASTSTAHFETIQITDQDISQTELSPGDLVIVCFRGDGTDGFGFTTLVNLKEGTEIYFTDAGWEEDDQWYRNNSDQSGEGLVTFTAPAGAVAGSHWYYDNSNPDAVFSTTDKINNLGTTGDQLIAYQGEYLNPSMITAVDWDGAWATIVTSTQVSVVPKGLTDGVDALSLPHLDNYAYTGSTLSGLKDDLLAAVMDPANWTGANSTSGIPSCPAPFSVTQTSSDVAAEISDSNATTCAGGNDGSLTVTVTDGVAPYSYTWTSGDVTLPTTDVQNTVTGLSPGSYSVTVRDANATEITVSGTVAEPEPVAVSISSFTNPSCAGAMDGTVMALATGGTGSYTYSWNSGDMSGSITGKGAGSYTVTVSDDNGCGPVQDTQTLTEPSGLSIAVVGSDPSCLGNDGQMIISGLPANSPFTIHYNDGANQSVLSTTNSSGEITISGLSGGSITGIQADNGSCSSNTATLTLTADSGPSISVNGTDPTCAGNDGSLQIEGLQDGFTYDVSYNDGAPQNTTASPTGGLITISGLGARTITGISVDSIGCSSNVGMVTLTAPSSPAISVGKIDPSCAGADGILQINGLTDASTYDVFYIDGTARNITDSPVSGTISISGFDPGTVTSIQVDSAGCTSNVESVTFSNPTGPSMSTITTDPSCSNDDGSIQLTGLASATSYNVSFTSGTIQNQILVSDGSGSILLTGLAAGTYSDIQADDGICVSTTPNVSLSAPGLPSVSITSFSNPTCAGLANGTLTALATGGSGNYTYSWNSGEGTASISNKMSGSYTVSVTDDLGCGPVQATQTLTDPSPVAVSMTNVIQPSCGSGSDGSMEAVATGGSGTYSFSWDSGESTAAIASKGAGTYVVTVTDDNGCGPVQASETLSNFSAINVVISNFGDPTCSDTEDGFVVATASGGSGNYTYNWSSGETTDSIFELGSGEYTVTVTDDASCPSATAIQEIFGPEELSVSISSFSNPTCGSDNGEVVALASGGTGALTYSWSSGENTPSISGKSSGTYTVTVTDEIGCGPVQASQVLVGTGELAVSFDNVVQPSCFGVADGALSVLVTGGSGNYAYSWSSGANTSSLSNLEEGNYEVTVSDDGDCPSVTVGETITAPLSLELTLDAVVNPSCGIEDGSVAFTASGGSGNYTYSWNSGETTPAISGKGAGTYVLTLTDDKGCGPVLDSVTLISTSGLTLTFEDVKDPSCAGKSDGLARVLPSGGSGSYGYSWTTGETLDTIGGKADGTYIVTVTDLGGCGTAVDTVVLNEPAEFMASLGDVVDPTCAGRATGSVSTDVEGGTLPYTFNWSNGSVAEDLTGIRAGAYSVEISDANSCATFILETQLTDPEALSVVMAEINDPTCFGVTDGNLTVLPTGGSGNYSYSWSNGATTSTIENLSAGNYFVTVVDMGGCGGSVASATLTEPNALNIANANAFDPSCYDATDGVISVQMSGGTGDYVYTWNTGATAASLFSLGAGSYSLSVTDENNCGPVTRDFNLVAPSAPTSMAGTDQMVTDGSTVAQLDAMPVTGGLEGTWSIVSGPSAVINDPFSANSVVSELQNGTYLFVWAVQQGTCTPVEDTVEVIVEQVVDIETPFASGELSIGPNPVRGELAISGNSSAIEYVQLVDMTGQVIEEWKGDVGLSPRLDVNDHPDGMYLLQIKTEHETVTKRFMKAH